MRIYPPLSHFNTRRTSRIPVILLSLIFGFNAVVKAEKIEMPPQKSTIRIVSTFSAATETLCELGLEPYLVGVNYGTKYPPSVVKNVPVIGKAHSLNSEGILSLSPTDVFLPANRRSNTVRDQLRKAQVKVHEIPTPKDLPGTWNLIESIAEVMAKKSEGDALIERIKKEVDKAQLINAKLDPKPRGMFIYARGLKTLYVGGTGTSAENLMHLAGATNCLTSFASFQPMTAENVIKANPDVYMAFASGVDSLGGADELFKLPGVGLTPAGKKKNIIILDSGSLNFGPRIGSFILEVASQIKDL